MPPQRRSFYASLSVLLVLLGIVTATQFLLPDNSAGPQATQENQANVGAAGTTTETGLATTPATTGTATANPATQTGATTAPAATELQPAPKSLLTPIKGELARSYGMAFNPALQEFKVYPGMAWTAPLGTRVVAAAPGKIVGMETDPEFGNMLLQDVGGGWTLKYAGISPYAVKVGDTVAAGQALGILGPDTGNDIVDGPRLFFAVKTPDGHIDPAGMMTAAAESGN
jgi:murein DD-endopeptidase MepM/ murein hydrolase activator NlpD